MKMFIIMKKRYQIEFSKRSLYSCIEDLINFKQMFSEKSITNVHLLGK